ncbi:MAG TPA: PBP1A family penicillin-binding protein [Candidatus Syntrophosphaera thermopropionivorans]|nr:PBP1A family penicillin-binding protein [Candidatus Syntrophosphaera thermopropionivorans]
MNEINKQKWNSVLKVIGIIFCICVGIFFGILWYYQDDLPPTSELKNYTLRTGSEVYDCNGKMVYLFAYERRKLVSLKELPQHLIDALLVTEDKRFYYHFGVDPIRMVKALITDLKTGEFSQGASTITQQLARNMFLTLDKKLSRKLQEIVLAFKIESTFSKDEILEIYLNKIFWGSQNHGIETASLYYFNKHARDLSLPEAALLVGMIQRPNYYDPFKHPDRAKSRRDLVLERMYKAKKISKEEYLEAIATPLNPQSGGVYARFASDYFIEYIRIYLENKYGTDRLFEGGLRIYTTLDADLSSAADSILNAYLRNVENSGGFRYKYSSVPKDAQDIDTKYIQGGLVLMENKTGYVRTLIGGRNFEHSKFNRMTQARRQPGSSIKPTYYTLAIERGYTPATILDDAPITIGNWSPSNADNKYHGPTRMRVALQWSYNAWAVRCAQDLGLSTLNEAFKRFGLNIYAQDMTASLGAYEVVPINLISAYTAFPNEGMRVKPVFITKVEDIKGNVLERGSIQKYSVCSPQVAYLMTSMLQTVASSGTGAASRNGYFWDNAGKTGTTDANNDSWFIGFNKAYTLGIWMGFDNNKIKAGSAQAVRIWGPIMTQAIKNDNKGRTPKPNDSRYSFTVPPRIVQLNINPYTGLVVSSGGIPEVFIEDNIPPTAPDSLRYGKTPGTPYFKEELEQEF